jgi:predicted nucleotidyltransferase
MSSPASPSYISELARRCDREWPTMAKSERDANFERARRAAEFSDSRLIPADTGLIVFGSMARGEWTQGSDFDWTLLIDGQVDGQHADIARKIAERVRPPDKKDRDQTPGPTGVFGGLTFSHDIVHFIGGDDDTNTNTTRRVLLLLESKSLTDDAVRERVLKAVLSRYVGEDLLYHEPAKFLVPRFLLNDYVRYWRMMAVDSAQKRRDRVDKWALRNVKLRLSRKLIFVAGFWACLSCRLSPSGELEASGHANDREAVRAEMTNFLFSFCGKPPLETLAEAFIRYEAWDAAKRSFDAYEDFLTILNNADLRNRLETLAAADAVSDEIFVRAKRAAEEFQAGLTILFFGTNSELTSMAQIDGVF